MRGMGNVNQEYKVLHNVQKGIVQYLENGKMWGGGGGGAIFEPKTLSMYLKKKKKKKKKKKLKKIDRAGIRTHDLQV